MPSRTGRRWPASPSRASGTTAALLASRGLDLAATTAYVEATVCDLDVAAGELAPGEACWPVGLRNARPTPTGLVLSFSPYEADPYALGPRDLFVPWAELDARAVRPAHRALRDALASGEWAAVAVLVPAEGDLLVGTGERVTDPVGLLRSLPRDSRPELRSDPARFLVGGGARSTALRQSGFDITHTASAQPTAIPSATR